METCKRILVVDDEEQLLFTMARTLDKLGPSFEVITARNGREALDRLKEARFDLVITDLRMPDVDGVELTETIRGLYPAAVVIWMTAYDNPSTRNAACQLAVHRYLTKPFDVIEIREVAREALATAGVQSNI